MNPSMLSEGCTMLSKAYMNRGFWGKALLPFLLATYLDDRTVTFILDMKPTKMCCWETPQTTQKYGSLPEQHTSTSTQRK